MTGARIRTLVVYHHLPHYRYDLFKRLENDPTLEVEFAAADTSSDGSIVTIPGGSLNTFHALRNVWFGRFLWQVGLLSLILRRRPHVVIFLGDCKHLSTWAGAVVARGLGLGVLFWTIGWFRPETGLHRLYKLAFYRLSDRLLIYGDVGRALGERMGYPADRMTTVYNSSSGPMALQTVSPARLKTFEASLPAPDRLVVTTVIRLNAVKRLDLLVRAAAMLRAEGRPVEVLLVGEGPERDPLVSLAHELEVPLWLPGPAYSDEELQLVYERTSVTVVPSAAGLTVLQSLKFGRPVITHDNMDEQVPECEAIEPGVTGDYYHYGDLGHLAATMGAWLDRQRDCAARTARDCRHALQATWNADVQAQIIGDQVRGLPALERSRR